MIFLTAKMMHAVASPTGLEHMPGEELPIVRRPI